PVEVAGPQIKPLAELYSVVLRHPNSRIARFAHTKRHIEVRLCRPGDPVKTAISKRIQPDTTFQLFEHKKLVNVPSHFSSTHPERIDVHGMHGPFVWVAFRTTPLVRAR